MSKHIVLLGDSIFDNDGYVLGAAGVIEQLRQSIPKHWSATKLAVDGDCIADVYQQLDNMPTHVTDIIVSIGGNDMRKYRHLVQQIHTPNDIDRIIAPALQGFKLEYSALLDRLVGLNMNLVLCTVYTAIPFEEASFREYAPFAIGLFNSVIQAEAKSRNIPVINLEEVCTEDEDFSTVSPIEPSSAGGRKIVDCIIERLRGSNT